MRPSIVGEGLVEPSQVVQRERAQGQHERTVGLQFVALVAAGESFLEAPRLQEKKCCLVGCVPMARIELERLLKAQHRIRRALHLDEGITQLCP